MPNVGSQKLLLDPENPRLPEHLHSAESAALVKHYLTAEAADELVASLINNGYFEHEPLLVRPEENGFYTVLEGNRRLAALRLIHGVDRPDEFQVEATADQVARVSEIPCVEVADRDAVHRLIGYRHIGGLKKWKPEAKARFLLREVEAAQAREEANPFQAVALAVGSNSQGVRQAYLAMRLLLWARDDRGVDVAGVQYDRFGVWLRCMNSADVRGFFHLENPKTYDQINEAIENQVDVDRFREVLTDLVNPEGGRAVLADSRQVTIYGRVLQNPRAYDALRTYQNLDIASQIVRLDTVHERVRDLAKRVQLLTSDVQDSQYSEELGFAVDELIKNSRTLQAAVRGLTEAVEG